VELASSEGTRAFSSDGLSEEPARKIRRLNERSTLRGLTTGVVRLRQGCGLAPCVVFGGEFPSWLPVLQELGFQAIFVALRSSLHLKSVENLVDHTCAVWSGPNWTVLASQMPFFASGQRIPSFVDGKVTGELRTLCETMGVHTMICTEGSRRPIKGWAMASQKVLHALVGGVTLGEATLTAFVRGNRKLQPSPLPYMVGRDASTVLSVQPFVSTFRAIPPPRDRASLSCVNLGTESHPFYHGGGLLPAYLDKRVRVLAPALFAPKGLWGLRHLTSSEVLVAKDFSPSTVGKLPPELITNSFLANLVPGKCLVFGFRALFNGGGDGEETAESIVRNNEEKTAESIVHNNEEKTAESIVHNNEAKTAEAILLDNAADCSIEPMAITEAMAITGAAIMGGGAALTGDCSSEFMAIASDCAAITGGGVALTGDCSIEPMAITGDCSIKSMAITGDCSIKSMAITGDRSIASMEAISEIGMTGDYSIDPMRDSNHSGLVKVESGLALGSQDMVTLKSVSLNNNLISISKDMRERKATKSDDAPVPMSLWEEHLVDDGTREWTPLARKLLSGACDAWRKRMLIRWKGNVSSTFRRWLNDKYSKELKEVDDAWGTEVKFEKAETIQGPTGIKILKKARYVWSRGQTSLDMYVQWWKGRMMVCSEDLLAGMDGIGRAFLASWWDWEDGSRPFHWRWPREYQEQIRDGIKVHFKEEPPRYVAPQRDVQDQEVKDKVIEKLQKVRTRRYIAEGYVVSLTSFFAVPKGEGDIRMVYDGSIGGLNDALWVPRLVLSTLNAHLRAVEEGTYMSDLDVGECFLNFMLHPSLRPYAGVDFTRFFPAAESETIKDDNGKSLASAKVWETWFRAAMGLKSSPYQAVQALSFAEEIIRGDRHESENIFRWDKVRRNLPGSDNYNPGLPWISKVRSEDGKIAADLFTFMDDFRPTGPTKKEAWLAGRRTASILNTLGIQDAARKRRDSSRAPGAWAGAVLRTDGDGVHVLVSQEKWIRTKAQLLEIREMLDKDSEKMSRKRLEEIRGFLVYVTRTYVGMAPYLIGLHMTIDSWRAGRDAEGWRTHDEILVRIGEDEEWMDATPESEQPALVKAVPRLRDDVDALTILCRADQPPLRRVRCSRHASANYGFGDASGCGFGATLQIGDGIEYEYGQWSWESQESSNWRELNNLVEFAEGKVRDKELEGCELFIFTDNTTAEAAFWKGSSKSRKLFDLVLRLRKLEMEHDMIIHVVHVSGKRMIAQGTDGLSRADHSEGVMQGRPMMDYMPLHLNPLVRDARLKPWLNEVTRDLDARYLSPEGWFEEGHGYGTYIWTAAPAEAEVVVEQLGRARLKRPESMHIIVVPRVMTGRWRRHMTRGSDVYFKLDWENVWPLSEQYEPLLIFVCLPFAAHSPRHKQKEMLLEEFRGFMLREELSKVPEVQRRNFLRKFLKRARAFQGLPGSMVRPML
jgi:hypothetical protein